MFETIFLELKVANFKKSKCIETKKPMHVRIKDQTQLRNKDKIFSNATEVVYRRAKIALNKL